ncbi:MAG: hypothetical protein KatS3mg057_2895 [Herpetosiphonaceae bacterium]|nr:MAG: hypothetical protein KatS3mg057_2895 [Herpetosiphonaceae bacterium]
MDEQRPGNCMASRWQLPEQLAKAGWRFTQTTEGSWQASHPTGLVVVEDSHPQYVLDMAQNIQILLLDLQRRRWRVGRSDTGLFVAYHKGHGETHAHLSLEALAMEVLRLEKARR